MEGVIVQKSMHNQKGVGPPALSGEPVFFTALKQGLSCHWPHEGWTLQPVMSWAPRYFFPRKHFLKCVLRRWFPWELKQPDEMCTVWGDPWVRFWRNIAYSGLVFERHIHARILSQDNKDIKGFLRSPPVKTPFLLSLIHSFPKLINPQFLFPHY